MQAHQRSHLFASYLAMVELLDEMEAIAQKGRVMASYGTVVAPLPQKDWMRLAEPLRRIRQRLRDVVARHVPDALNDHESALPVEATRQWLSVLLLRLEDEVTALHPAHFQRQYGEIPQEVAQTLAAFQRDLAQEVARARAALCPEDGE